MDNIAINWRSQLREWEKTHPKTMSPELQRLRDDFVLEFSINSLANLENIRFFLLKLRKLARQLTCFQEKTNDDLKPKTKKYLFENLVLVNDYIDHNEFEIAAELYSYAQKDFEGERIETRETFVTNIFYWYYPDKLLPIFDRQDCVDFLHKLGCKEEYESLLAINHQFLFHLKSLPEFDRYDSCQIASFLYDCFNLYKTTNFTDTTNVTREDAMTNLTQDKMTETLKNVSEYTKNIILYGPPGTGKTYSSKKFAKYFLDAQLQSPLTAEEIRNKIFKDLNWYEIIAVVLYLNKTSKPKMKASEIQKEPLIQDYWRTTKTAKLGNMIQAMLQAHTDPSVGTVRYSNRQKPFIFEKTVDSYWFLTDEGIEYVDLELEKQVQALTSPISSEPDLKTYIDSVTFHQSFSYEEFIEGIKPLSDEDGNITYPVVDGVFKKFCKQAEADPDRTYLFIIDEINRANIAKVFGELITIIEDDKRGTEVKLPYSQELFSVPKNLYIIGTMNTADRSIALLDIALRRRFAFVEVLPDPELVKTVAGIDLRKLLTALNQTITATLGRDYQIGHSYFLGLEDQQALEFAWYYRVIPLLQEYYYSDRESLQKILGKFIVSENNGVESNHRSPSAYRIEQLTGEDFRKAIEAISNDRPR